MDLEKFWNKTVKKGHKHFTGEMTPDKIQKLQNRFQTHVLHQINTDQLKSSVDWGCGGGLLSKMMPDHTELHLVDLTQPSLDEAQKYIKRPAHTYKLPNTEELHNKNIDLLWCYSVIHHFPSIAYFNNVCKEWNKIRPKRIAIKTKFYSDKSKQQEDYKANFLHALILKKEDILDQFEDYKCTYWKTIETNSSWHFGFMIMTLN